MFGEVKGRTESCRTGPDDYDVEEHGYPFEVAVLYQLYRFVRRIDETSPATVLKRTPRPGWPERGVLSLVLVMETVQVTVSKARLYVNLSRLIVL